jgi:hypothetical protein
MSACGARTRSGEPCRRAASQNGRCRNHGGASLPSIASPTLRTGRYSKHLPTRMASRYREAQDDPELLVLRDEIALLDSRLSDVLSRVDTGESGAIWAELQKSWQAFSLARSAGNVPRMTELLAEHEALLTRGRTDYAAWAEVGSLLDRRARFVESERRRYVEMQQMVALDQVMLFLGAVTDVLRRHVTDRDTLAAIGRELDVLADGQPRAALAGRRRAG